ncbi:MAG: helix-turn-helix domain-containing protein [Planctomycetia bacterium]|nr:helix-turn-helix domain-containing protein [Planctomycetia bacterium]
MAGQFLNVEEVANLLHLTNAEVVQLSNSGKIHGYRDGATWKYKQEAIEEYLKKQREAANRESADDDYGFESYGDSDLDLKTPSDSDIILNVDDDDEMEDAIPAQNVPDQKAGNQIPDDSGISLGSSDINLTLDEDVTLDSSVELSDFDDGDLVLGEEDGVGQGSSLSLGEGSGISLMSANDSGISLEGDEEVLELGDDDILAMSSGVSGLNAAEDGDFDLTTSDDFGDDDDEDSGSQVIVLDDSSDASNFGDGFDAEAGMFSEDLSGGGDEMGVLAQKNQVVISDAGLPEKPYTIWNILGLICCFIVLTFTLLFSIDLMRNMWSWDKPTQLNSAMMDWIIELLGGK